MNWMDNLTKTLTSVNATVSDLATTATSVASKVKGLSVPSIRTQKATDATINMTSEKAPGVSVVGMSQKNSYILLGLAGALVLFLIIRR